MGALTSLTKWIPEDDLLLKNAVEAGASLESLAKGAVPFSRRFTIHELQDRWRSLLYDLDTSAEASARIVEIELDLASSSLPKANKTCNSKGKDTSSGKRKADSVCSHYYALRKRIHSEPLSSDLGYLVPPMLIADTAYDSRTQCKQSVDNFTLDYSHHETGYESGQNVFPELMRVDSSAINAEHVGLIEGKVSDKAAGEGCLFGYSENISSLPLEEAGCNNGTQSFEHTYHQKDFPDILGDNLISVHTSSDVHQIRQTNALGTSSSYENDENDDDHDRNHCSDFIRNDNLISHVPDCSSSLHELGYSCPSSSVPIWRTMEDTPTPMPMDGHFLDKDQELLKMDDKKKIDGSGCDIAASSEPKLDDGMCAVGPTIMSEDEFMDFSDTYMDFADDDELFHDVGEKDISDISHLNNLNTTMLSSPSNTQHVVANSDDHGSTNILEMGLEIPHGQKQHSDLHDYQTNTFPGVNMPSTSSQTTNTVEPQQEYMICVLNTQDKEIPNNDHVIFPEQSHPPFSTNLEQCTKENTGVVSSATAVSRDERAPIVGDLDKVKEDAPITEPIVSSLKTDSTSLPKIGRAEKVESSEGGSVADNSRHVSTGGDEPNLSTPAMVTTVVALKEESRAPNFEKHDDLDASFASFLEDHLQETDNAQVYTQNATDSYPEEAKLQSSLQACLSSRQDPVSADTGLFDTVAVLSTSDHEEQHSDIEDDIPHFSDIEALILDMDLGPYDEESCLLSKEASRFKRMDTKNTIRWEQGFRSYINRSILSHSAFAVFYGRHLKYFIKDSEVSLGRETEDVKVDIDLGREGRANKISRRQAIIKMDEEGVFFLNNLGKFPIFVNGKEVPAKKRINLLLCSLVEIQGMHFMFEVNESAVRRYIMNLQRSSQERNTRFDWKPDQH